MNCGEAKRLMQTALAGDASADGRERLDAHVAECTVCAREWKALSGAAEALTSAQPEPLPADRDLSGAVMAQIARETNGPLPQRSWLAELLASRPMQAVGAVAATVVFAIILWLAAPSGQVLALLMGGGPSIGY